MLNCCKEIFFMLWTIKNNILINWSLYIMEHMLKCKDNNMNLPYVILISRNFHVFNINLSRETCVHLDLTNYFGKKNIPQIKYLVSMVYGKMGWWMLIMMMKLIKRHHKRTVMLNNLHLKDQSPTMVRCLVSKSCKIK